ncbi:arsenate reductase/protein-tyrosine-phosphatase family protein [Sanguibacter suarezii]|uniref:arsenate reductase/protein-tyrosine-phosphatase family protein n=1 Tax=Sanguibacter suarezii TaxID=60921 RepID=UPI00082E8680|nr:protein tyrosine phosphatase [Sanguibacter suarezii]
MTELEPAVPEPVPVAPFTVLAVCTGNICRSPAVERLLGAALGPASGIEVRSAGTRAMVGSAIPADMARLLVADGVSPEGFAARQLTEAMLRESRLVLALTREHRSRIVELFPGAVRRTFTVRELARLAAGVAPGDLGPGTPAERLAALLPLAAAQRGQRPSTPDDDDVVDPYGRSETVYAQSFAELAPAVRQIAATVRG